MGLILGKQITTTGHQNVSGTNDSIGFFPYAWPEYSQIQPGWRVVGHTDWIVTNVNGNEHVIEISGGTFVSGSFYSFVSSAGFTITGGITLNSQPITPPTYSKYFTIHIEDLATISQYEELVAPNVNGIGIDFFTASLSNKIHFPNPSAAFNAWVAEGADGPIFGAQWAAGTTGASQFAYLNNDGSLTLTPCDDVGNPGSGLYNFPVILGHN